jgi:chromosomal replication initiation ATPase DnaA
MPETAWGQVLERLRATIDPDEYRRWFSASSQASDSGDQITVWVPASTDAKHISVNYLDRIYRELEQMDRFDVTVRFVATGYEEDEDEEDREE